MSDDSTDEVDMECVPASNDYLSSPQSLIQIPCPNDISQTLDEGPRQPHLKMFPNTVYGIGVM